LLAPESASCRMVSRTSAWLPSGNRTICHAAVGESSPTLSSSRAVGPKTLDQGQPPVSMRTQLLLPMRGREELVGIMSLGPKLSESPYSDTDIRLAEAIVGQMGLAVENTLLLASLAAEAASRERLNREVEIAREVQERLFPRDLPALPGIDYAGFCRPARGVGGDYYDFLQLADGKLGHNPPLILRGAEALRLEAGGPVIGWLPGATYSQARVQLEPGDVFIRYTDGITEALNEREEEWGESGS